MEGENASRFSDPRRIRLETHWVRHLAFDTETRGPAILDFASSEETYDADYARVRALEAEKPPPNVALPQEICHNRPRYQIVIPVEGNTTLANRMRPGEQGDPGEVLQVIRQAAVGLDYAHWKEIAHAALEPADIVVDDVADDGSVPVQFVPFPLAPHAVQPTPDEDVQTLAAITYKWLTGEEPAPSQAPSSSHLSDSARRVFQRALSPSLKSRFTSASSFAGALSIAMNEAPAADLFALEAPAVEKAPEIANESAADQAAGEEMLGTTPRRIALALLLFLVAAGSVMYFVRLRSERSVPVQVLETKATPAMAAPVTAPLARVNTPPAHASMDSQTPSTSMVEILTQPPGAKVQIDGKDTANCTTPCNLPLSSGRHSLSARLEGFQPANRIFNVPQSRSVIIPLEGDTGTLVLSSDPSGLPIFVDGAARGNTPATLRLTAGVHNVAVSNGSQQHAESLTIQPGSLQARSLKW